jgi:hypothetical protein
MKISYICPFILFQLIAVISFSQHVKLIEGDATILKNVRIIFTYENTRVGKYDKEQDFVSHKKGGAKQKGSWQR